MLEDAPLGGDALANPTEIDAHLMYAALDSVAVLLRWKGQRVQGRFDLADGFGELAFIDQRSGDGPSPPLSGQVAVEYYFGASAIFRFETRVIAASSEHRYRLARPLRIARSERRSVPRFRLMGRVDYTFAFEGAHGPVMGELADLSNQGARLLVARSAGLDRGGQRIDGWLGFGAQAKVPVTVEVRHVAPYDVGRVSVGVRFVEIRALDRARLTRHLVGLTPDAAA